jgi:HK97 family phage portal protein
MAWLGIGKKKAVTTYNASTANAVNSRGWYSILEPFTGAWQRNIEWKRESVLSFSAIFSCITLISSDIAKLRVKLVKEINDGIWQDIGYGEYKVISKPNKYQNRIQFFENWMNSKLTRGNTYVLKERNNKGVVTALYILNPDLVQVLVSDSGEVFYQLSQDNLAGIELTSITVPASEIIHDRFNCLFHPLVGLSPIFACGLAAYQGLQIQENSARFFRNQSKPGGVLTAPGSISDETAARLKEHWDVNYSGENSGKVAVLGDGLKYEAMAVTPVDAQMVEQLKLSADVVCSAFHVPSYKVIGSAPSYNNIEALEQQYYSQCLQMHIESIELLLDEGLEIAEGTGTEFDLEGLLRMDTKTQIEALAEEVKGGISTPNEARRVRNKMPLTGGNTVYLQQQNFSLEALARRDATENPFSAASPAAPAEDSPSDTAKFMLLSELSHEIKKQLVH